MKFPTMQNKTVKGLQNSKRKGKKMRGKVQDVQEPTITTMEDQWGKLLKEHKITAARTEGHWFPNQEIAEMWGKFSQETDKNGNFQKRGWGHRGGGRTAFFFLYKPFINISSFYMGASIILIKINNDSQ